MDTFLPENKTLFACDLWVSLCLNNHGIISIIVDDEIKQTKGQIGVEILQVATSN